MSAENPKMTEANGQVDRLPVEEAYVTSGGRVRLFTSVHPVQLPQGVILLAHGLGEHSGRYGHVIHRLQERNLSVVRFDMRGHGRSEGKRGHAPSFRALLDDFSLMFRRTRERYPDVPLILLGHSLGGNIVANWLLRRREEAVNVQGVVLSSTWFTLTKQPPPLKVHFISALSRVFPRLMIPAGLRPRKLTRNPIAIAAYENDTLVHKKASVRLVTEAYFAGLWALDHARELTLPLLAVHGTADSVTNPAGTALFAERAPDSTLILYEDYVHEPHNEPEWTIVVDDIGNWITNLLSQQDASSECSRSTV